MAEFFASFIGNGVFWGGNYLKVESFGGNMDIQVLEGKGWINGYIYFNKDAPKVMSLEPAHLTLPRIDAVVLRLDLTEQKRAITAEIKTGVPANHPVVPALQRDKAIWELKLAEIRVNANVSEIYAANIIDYRLKTEECGVVTNFVPNGFNLDNIFNQYLSQLERRMSTWDATKQRQANDWNAQMAQQDTEFHNTFDAKRSEIDAWYASIKSNMETLKTFDFDNIAELKGCTKKTMFPANGSIIERIFVTASNKTVATRTTIFNEDGSIGVNHKVYKEDGATILKDSTIKTTFGADDSIDEGVV